MENTVVGVYDSYTQAQNALNELLSSGFSRGDVRLSPDSDNGIARGSEQAGGSGIGHFFRSLFGMEEHHEHRDIYSEAVRRGSCVLTVNAASEEQRDRATEIMNRHDPVDIDERSAHWRTQGWSGYDETAPMFTDSEIEKDRSLFGQARETADAGSVPVAGEEVEAGQRDVQRGGVRVYQRQRDTTEEPAVPEAIRATEDLSQQTTGIKDTLRATAVEVEQLGATDNMRSGDYADTAMSSEDSDYRMHWQNAYGQAGGRYEDYDAAYRYGSTMAGSERYKNYRWEDAEPTMRSEWESSHPESAWDKVKDAVRYGVEKVTGRH